MTKIAQKSKVSTSSTAVIAATLLALPGSASLAQQTKSEPSAQSVRKAGADANLPTKTVKCCKSDTPATPDHKLKSSFKLKGQYWVAGNTRRQSVFEDARGGLFYLDATTGDQKFVVRKAGDKFLEFNFEKQMGKVWIVGTEAGGNLIMKNAKGENFYLDPANGDLVFVRFEAGR